MGREAAGFPVSATSPCMVDWSAEEHWAPALVKDLRNAGKDRQHDGKLTEVGKSAAPILELDKARAGGRHKDLLGSANEWDGTIVDHRCGSAKQVKKGQGSKCRENTPGSDTQTRIWWI